MPSDLRRDGLIYWDLSDGPLPLTQVEAAVKQVARKRNLPLRAVNPLFLGGRNGLQEYRVGSVVVHVTADGKFGSPQEAGGFYTLAPVVAEDVPAWLGLCRRLKAQYTGPAIRRHDGWYSPGGWMVDRAAEGS